jgi:hypothetical protein
MDEYEFEIDDDCDIDTDFESVAGFNIRLVGHKIRTAKRDYECSKCHNKIAANTKYMDFTTRYIRTRFCIDCGKYITGED